ncbi:hypothetical protein Tco_1291006, partial [Tanacetum coccineum]
MVAFLTKTEGNDDFADIVDFLNASSIRYSLTNLFLYFDVDDLVKFQELLLDAEKPLYEGCLDFTKLSTIVKLLNLKGSGYKKIHVCINNCLLYWKDDKDLTACRTCGISRWKVDNKTHKVYEDIPAKRIIDGVLCHPADSQAWRTINEKFPEIAEDPRNL